MPRKTDTRSTTAPNDGTLPNVQAPAHTYELSTLPGLPASMLDVHALRSALESLLFIAGRPVPTQELRKLLVVDERRLREALDALEADCERMGRGIRLQRMGDQVQFVSAPENARFVAALLGLPTQARLTTAALETLAVVAYRQPMTRSQIEAIRGVNSDRALASLLQHGLVIEVGRAGTVGRPALFGTTAEFLQHFGLGSLEALPRPDLPEAEAIEANRHAAASRIRGAIGVGEGSAEGGDGDTNATSTSDE
jgi:segregation and condensation protein B